MTCNGSCGQFMCALFLTDQSALVHCSIFLSENLMAGGNVSFMAVVR